MTALRPHGKSSLPGGNAADKAPARRWTRSAAFSIMMPCRRGPAESADRGSEGARGCLRPRFAACRPYIQAMSWTRTLSRPVGRFHRLSDVRDFILSEFPEGPGRAWHHIGTLAVEAADGGDTRDLEISLAIVVAHSATKRCEI
jgi:hypothetical protein